MNNYIKLKYLTSSGWISGPFPYKLLLELLVSKNIFKLNHCIDGQQQCSKHNKLDSIVIVRERDVEGIVNINYICSMFPLWFSNNLLKRMHALFSMFLGGTIIARLSVAKIQQCGTRGMMWLQNPLMYCISFGFQQLLLQIYPPAVINQAGW